MLRTLFLLLMAGLMYAVWSGRCHAATQCAGGIEVGDTRRVVLAKLQVAPVKKQARIVLGVPQETLTFRSGLSSYTVVYLVFDRVVVVDTQESTLPEVLLHRQP
ncbi:MAG: hypothetical protein HZB71_11285 [Betaproteobacteria bacterium]|nr:hypothetical protein [Betaproteobacteria bacterium]